MVGGALVFGVAVRAADRRRRHARRDLAPERLHRPRRGRDRLRAREQRSDRQRHARRRLGDAADVDDGPRDEPLDRERALRRVRPGDGAAPRRSGGDATARVRSTTADDVAVDARLREQGRRRARLRDGGRAGAARRARARRPPRGARRRGDVRDPPGRRAHAGPHERPPRRGERPVSTAQGDGRGERRVRAHGRRRS